MTPLHAVTDADPYPLYAHLRAQGGLSFDTGLKAWIASGAQAVQAVLEHPGCQVRPVAEPIPAALGQGAASQVFQRLMRMNEGPAHLRPRAVMVAALAAIPREAVVQAVAEVARSLGDSVQRPETLMFTLPVSTLATLMGFAADQLHGIAAQVRAFVACLSPLSDAAALHRADLAAAALMARVTALLDQPGPASALINSVRTGCQASGWHDRQALAANLIGLMSQTCEATAGLIGNALVALHRAPELVDTLRSDRASIGEWVAEVARHDPPVQSTRRFVTERCSVQGQVLEAGDSVVVLLASANRDACVHLNPDRFMAQGPQRRTFSFGSGRHQCPGQALALILAAHAVELWLQQPGGPALSLRWDYWPSLNARMPRFHCAQEARP